MSLNLTGGKVGGFGNGAHANDQGTASDKPIGPEPKSTESSPQKKQGQH